MAEEEKTLNDDQNFEQRKRHLEDAYEELSGKLREEKSRLEREMKHEYRNARRYVRANPEQGMGIAFASGIVIGLLLSKLTNRDY